MTRRRTRGGGTRGGTGGWRGASCASCWPTTRPPGCASCRPSTPTSAPRLRTGSRPAGAAAAGRGPARDRAASVLAHVGAAARGHRLAGRDPRVGGRVGEGWPSAGRRLGGQRWARPRRRGRWRAGRCSARCSGRPGRRRTPGRPSTWPRGPATAMGGPAVSATSRCSSRSDLGSVWVWVWARGYRESVEAAAQARLRLAGDGLDAARRCLDVQLGLAAALGGSCTAAVAAGRRALAGLGPGERWLHGYVAITAALALYRQPGRRPECAGAAGEALSALQRSRGPGRPGLRARPAGLAGGRRRPVRALRLAARGGSGALGAGRRQARRQPGPGGAPRAVGRGRRPRARPRAVRGAARAGSGHADRADRRARGGGR